jgi:DNA (cytosine-5)-methyltransferase 1
VDRSPQPKYPYRFIQADAVELLWTRATWIRSTFDLVHASPPCQHDSDCQVIQGREHPDLIGPTREALEALGLPYVIENVGGAVDKLRDPVMLCGRTMFGLERTYRHRYFELGGWKAEQPEHSEHDIAQTKMGRAPRPGEAIQAVGNFSGVSLVRSEWDVPWMNREGIREAIPPAYTRWVGEQFKAWKENQK